MAGNRLSNVVMVGLVCAAVVGLALAARTTIHMKKLSGDFRQEVSERFDLEAKIATMERQQAEAQDQIKGLLRQLKDSESALDRMKTVLEKETQEKKVLAQEIEKLQGAVAPPPSNKT